jgi:hypothetical protein
MAADSSSLSVSVRCIRTSALNAKLEGGHRSPVEPDQHRCRDEDGPETERWTSCKSCVTSNGGLKPKGASETARVMTIRVDPEQNETSALCGFADLDGCRVLDVGCGDGRLTWLYADMAAHDAETEVAYHEPARITRLRPLAPQPGVSSVDR